MGGMRRLWPVHHTNTCPGRYSKLLSSHHALETLAGPPRLAQAIPAQISIILLGCANVASPPSWRGPGWAEASLGSAFSSSDTQEIPGWSASLTCLAEELRAHPWEAACTHSTCRGAARGQGGAEGQVRLSQHPHMPLRGYVHKTHPVLPITTPTAAGEGTLPSFTQAVCCDPRGKCPPATRSWPML